MPELPEVETTRRGIAPHLTGARITGWVIREARLRWPVVLPSELRGQVVDQVRRRGKYLILETTGGALILHLGMSGSLRILPSSAPAGKHDHIDLCFDNGLLLRLNDPRRFGSVHASTQPWAEHWLLASLGPEPVAPDFDGAHLHRLSRGRRAAVKTFLMDSRIVVGVGNIYANEALFRAGIRPGIAAGRISLARYDRLAQAVTETLAAAIDQGGTTLRNFVGVDGRPGYFRQTLYVYGRDGEPCRVCRSILVASRLGQRATVYCRACQA